MMEFLKGMVTEQLALVTIICIMLSAFAGWFMYKLTDKGVRRVEIVEKVFPYVLSICWVAFVVVLAYQTVPYIGKHNIELHLLFAEIATLLVAPTLLLCTMVIVLRYCMRKRRSELEEEHAWEQVLKRLED